MEAGRCRCNRACYLTDYGRQTWARGRAAPSALAWHRAPTTGVASGIRSGSKPAPFGIRRMGASWMGRLLPVVVLVLLVTASLTWRRKHSQRQDDDYSEYYLPDAKLTRILRSLNESRRAAEGARPRAAAAGITALFPWLPLNNTLPNYFLGGGEAAAVDHYAGGRLVFLDLHRSPGAPLVPCLRQDGRQVSLEGGPYALGACESYAGRCSYAAVFREPMARAVSSFHRCRSAAAGGRSDDALCHVISAADVTLRDWILVHGSLTFQQLLAHAPWCRRRRRRFPTSPPAGNLTLEGSALTLAPSGEWPCWLKQRYSLQRLPADQYAGLVDYVLDHLEAWLGVVGLADDWSDTVRTLEHVYRLPFGDCSAPEAPVGYHGNGARGGAAPRDGYYDENDPDYLRYDYFVRRALDADFRIYRRAKQIFSVQRQALFNKINR